VHFVEEAVRRIVILVSILDVLVQKAGLRRAEVEKTQSIWRDFRISAPNREGKAKPKPPEISWCAS
jgi:hypothetical protein